MVRHYDALGLRCEWRLSYGQIAWFLTYLRFLVQVLVADADYGMLLNDDVRGLCGNQPVSGAPDHSPLSHFSATTRPCWPHRTVRNRHRHAIEQVASMAY